MGPGRRRDDTRGAISPRYFALPRFIAEAAIKEGGPATAIGICTTVAPTIAGELSRQSGVQVTLVSLRVRNPLLGTPDAREQSVLLSFQDRLAKGEAADKIELAETVIDPAGRYFRYMEALPVQPVCVNCHGNAANFAPEVKERLACLSRGPCDRLPAGPDPRCGQCGAAVVAGPTIDAAVAAASERLAERFEHTGRQGAGHAVA